MKLTYSFDNRMGWYDEDSDIRTKWHTDKKYIYDMYKASMIRANNDLDCITIDGDIILTDKLNMPPSTDDVWFEYKETKKNALDKKFDIQNGYHTMIDIFKEADTQKYIPEFSYHNGVAWNVGFIKFNNQKTKDILLNGYYNLKNFYLTKIDNSFEFRKKGILPSLIVCQYHFGNLVTHHKLTAQI